MKKGNIQGAKAVIEALEAQGVEYIFGYPGGATLPIYDALAHSKITHILARHEQGAAHMADGYARATGKVGVCMATSGPGATNLVTGIATAFMDSSPIIAITGQVPQSMIGNDAFQEVDITGITLPITKHNYLIQDPEEILPVFDQAFYIASSGRKGPVLIDIPKNVLTAEFHRNSNAKLSLEGYNPTTKGHPGQIKKAVKQLEQAERPVIIAGGGAKGIHALVELSEKCQIPLVTSLMGKSSFPDRHPHHMGLYGYHGRVAANTAITKADVILSIGTRFTDRSTGPLGSFAADARIIHIDIDPAEISKNVPSFMPIVGDAGQIIETILGQIKGLKHEEWMKFCQKLKDENPLSEGKGDFSIPRVLNYLQTRLGKSPVTTDVGRHQIFAAHHLATDQDVPFITSGGLGTMGFGLPAALGTAFGLKGERVVCISGDGSFLMNCQEMVTASEHKLPITVLVMNDTQLGMIRQLQDAFYGKRYEACTFSQIADYPAMARSMGAEGGSAENLEELKTQLDKADKAEGTYIIDCIISMGENTYPMVTGSDLTSFMDE
ncbi:MAG: biosynthetic-type acetolactate synthase large subunit [Spirochaetales bacterium]|nr:biosynthetic-type acetolactate synthase large subunit [Spirochaetales bacterium]